MTTGMEISECGLRFRSNGDLSFDARVYVRLMVNSADLPDLIEATVKHISSDIVGIEFTKVPSSSKAVIAQIIESGVPPEPQP